MIGALLACIELLLGLIDVALRSTHISVNILKFALGGKAGVFSFRNFAQSTPDSVGEICFQGTWIPLMFKHRPKLCTMDFLHLVQPLSAVLDAL